jgi:hypothetical protein
MTQEHTMTESVYSEYSGKLTFVTNPTLSFRCQSTSVALEISQDGTLKKFDLALLREAAKNSPADWWALLAIACYEEGRMSAGRK